MNHLSLSEFVDLAEDTLAPARAAHAETCEACRAQAETVRAALRQTTAFDVPEPSPLFWEHFQSRVREGIAAEPLPRRPAWDWLGSRGLTSLSAALAVVLAAGIAVFGGGRLTRIEPRPGVENGAPQAVHTNDPAAAVSDQATPSVLDQDDSEAWAVLAAAAADLGLEEAHEAGMHVHPGTIDRAVQGMTPEELNELGRLLQSELKHPTG